MISRNSGNQHTRKSDRMAMKRFPKIVQADARGQIVIPKDIRLDLKINESTGFFVYSIDGEGILLKMINPADLSSDRVVCQIESRASKLGIKRANIEKAKKKYRKKKEGRLDLL